MTLTESKNSVTYSIKNKCIHKTHDTEYSLLILVSDIVDKHVDCFDLATVHFEDNVKNVLLIVWECISLTMNNACLQD